MQGILGEDEVWLSTELKEDSCEGRWGALGGAKKELHAKLRDEPTTELKRASYEARNKLASKL